ncbi:hypothetical protein BASA60_000981 [Batrachochytrium salamandrivorans]|nr:hypothetical protein BASA60_000981 [Batrachochytrium salamandrivorans]
MTVTLDTKDVPPEVGNGDGVVQLVDSTTTFWIWTYLKNWEVGAEGGETDTRKVDEPKDEIKCTDLKFKPENDDNFGSECSGI